MRHLDKSYSIFPETLVQPCVLLHLLYLILRNRLSSLVNQMSGKFINRRDNFFLPQNYVLTTENFRSKKSLNFFSGLNGVSVLFP